jgi:phosphoglycerate dehydrogenase-like enzyme
LAGSTWVHMADDPDALDEFLSMLDERVRVTTGQEPPDDAAYEILVAGVPERRLVEASSALTTLIIPWSGVPRRTRSLMREFSGVAVHNLHHNALQVAEMAMALLFAAAKSVIPMDRALRRGDWTPRYQKSPVLLLDGARVLVLGHGAIGRLVSRMCRAMGMKVTAVRRGEDVPADGSSDVRTARELLELLPSADVLFVCLPLTDETRGLIGARELSLLPHPAILVNVGRGAVVDESALYGALAGGALHAAGLDVWYNYPVDEAGRTSTRPSECPFGELDNVVLSPHRAGAPNTEETELARMSELAGLINKYAAGEELPNRVDLELGY